MTNSAGDEGAWLSAAEALFLVSEAMGPYLAPRAIASRAHDGLVRSRAKRFIKYRESMDDVELPQQFWWAGGEAALEQNWAAGDFSTWIDQKWHWKAYGVAFSSADIEDLLPKKERAAFPSLQPGNYAPAVTCLRELQKTMGCPSSTAQELILKGCRSGLIPARCEDFHCRVRDRYGEHEEVDRNVAVPQWFWEECLESEDAILNWKSGRFAGSGVVDDTTYKVIISGLEFQVGAIIELEGVGVPGHDGSPAAAPSDQAQVTIPRPGRKRGDEWKLWVAELVSHIHDHGFPDGVGSQGQEELIKAVAEALARQGGETLGRSTVQPIVQAVLDRHRSAKN